LENQVRIELTTRGLRGRYSTTELLVLELAWRVGIEPTSISVNSRARSPWLLSPNIFLFSSGVTSSYEIRTHACAFRAPCFPYTNEWLVAGGHLLVTTDESRMWGCAESQTLTGYFTTQCAFEKSKGTHRNLTMSISDRIYLARAAGKLFFSLTYWI